MNVAWGLHWGGKAGARNLVFFHAKWLQLAMEDTSCVRRVQLRSFRPRSVPPLCSAMNEWFMCACFFAFVDSLVADRSVMAL